MGALLHSEAMPPSVDATLGTQGVATCARPGCGKPTWNGQPNEYCGRTCRNSGALTARATTAPGAAAAAARPPAPARSASVNLLGAQAAALAAQAAQSGQPVQPALCPVPGCGKPSFNGRPGCFCCKSCRDAAGGNAHVRRLAAALAATRSASTNSLPTSTNPLPVASQQSVCLRPGCGKPSYNGQPGFCSRTCRDAAPAQGAPAAAAPGGALCLRPGCGKPTWNGAPNQYCSKTCKQAGGDVAFCTKATQQEYEDVQTQFTNKWDVNRGAIPSIKSVWVIHASKKVRDRFYSKCQAIGNVKRHGSGRNPGNRQRRFHGTFLRCKFVGKPCDSSACNACCIIKDGFDITKLGTGSGNDGYYGPGHYSTSMPATALGYGSGNALMLVKVAVGAAELTSSRTSSGVAEGYDSRVVNKGTGVDELLVPEDDQMLPAYLIMFS